MTTYPDFHREGPAPCTEVAPDMFFPDLEIPGSLAMAQEAKKICTDCPYKLECLEWALYNSEPGVWGGTTENERRKIRRSSRIRLPIAPKTVAPTVWYT